MAAAGLNTCATYMRDRARRLSPGLRQAVLEIATLA